MNAIQQELSGKKWKKLLNFSINVDNLPYFVVYRMNFIVHMQFRPMNERKSSTDSTCFQRRRKKTVEICSEVISHEMVLFPAVSR